MANLVQIENDSEIKQRLEAERMRLRKIAGPDQPFTSTALSSAPLPPKSGFRVVMLICAGLSLGSAGVAWSLISKDGGHTNSPQPR